MVVAPALRPAPPTTSIPMTEGRADRAPGWRWRRPRSAPGVPLPHSPVAVPKAASPRSTPRWRSRPEPEPEPEPEPPMWRGQPVHEVRVDLPQGRHGRRSNEFLTKRAAIPRDFTHLRARRDTPLSTLYFRAGPATKERPWAQPAPRRAAGSGAVRGPQPGDRVSLKAGLTTLANGVRARPPHPPPSYPPLKLPCSVSVARLCPPSGRVGGRREAGSRP